MDRFLVFGYFPRLTNHEVTLLQDDVTDEEVFSMGGWKALSLDGLLAMFFQSNWAHVSTLVTSWVKKFLKIQQLYRK